MFSSVDVALRAFRVPLVDVVPLVIASLNQTVAIAFVVLVASDTAAIAIITSSLDSVMAAIEAIAALVDSVMAAIAAIAAIVDSDMVSIEAIVAFADSNMVAIGVIVGFVASDMVAIEAIKFVQKLAVFTEVTHKSSVALVITNFTVIIAVLEHIVTSRLEDIATTTAIEAIVTARAIAVRFMGTTATVAELNLLLVAMFAVAASVVTAIAAFIKLWSINIEEDFEVFSCRNLMVKTGFLLVDNSVKQRMQRLDEQNAHGTNRDGYRGHDQNGGVAQGDVHDAVHSHMVPHDGKENEKARVRLPFRQHEQSRNHSATENHNRKKDVLNVHGIRTDEYRDRDRNGGRALDGFHDGRTDCVS